MWYQLNVSTQIARVRVPTWYVAENKVSDHDIGVPPLRKYANYRTLGEQVNLFISSNKPGLYI